ncbi:MAG: class I SAM-dependent methyltransferase [Terriglobia bacterium]
MNRLRNKYRANPPTADEHRPRIEFWGPVRGQSGDDLLDLDFAPDEKQPRPEHCPICMHRALLFVANVYGWPIYECRQCEGGFVWPQPSSELLDRLYGPDFWSNYLGSEQPLYCRPESVHASKRGFECLDRILQHNHKLRILDVGAGDGTMLRYLADAGYHNTLGIELDKQNARRAQDKLGVPVVSVDFLTFQESGWDTIMLWATVEHLRDPVSFLGHARDLLAPGGLFIVMTGDNSSFHAWFEGAMDYWVYPPNHLFYFTVSSLRWLFRNARFERFRWRLQFQPRWKESILWAHRLFRSARVRLSSKNRFWRSTQTNLLVAWGQKP